MSFVKKITYCRKGIFRKRVFFGIFRIFEKNQKITIFQNFPKKLSSDWLFVLQWMQSPTAWHTSHARPCVVTPWHVFGDIMIVLFCKHISCGHWVLVLRICTFNLSAEFSSITIRIGHNLHLQIPKIRLFWKSKLAEFRKLHASEKYPFYSRW